MRRFVLAIFIVLQLICILLAVGSVVWHKVKYDITGFENVLGKKEDSGFVFWIAHYATWLCVPRVTLIRSFC